MEDFAFGDILDARSDPTLKHFVVVVGIERTRGKESVLYYLISSRTYKPFKKIVGFFNICINDRYKPFVQYFGKERGCFNDNKGIIAQGPLCQALFLDESKYEWLDEDSYIVLQSEPERIDIDALRARRKEGLLLHQKGLNLLDVNKLMTIIKFSSLTSTGMLSQIARSFNLVNKQLAALPVK